MKKLNLPDFKKPMPPAKTLSMEDYLKFIYINLKYFPNGRGAKKGRPPLSESTPFVLR